MNKKRIFRLGRADAEWMVDRFQLLLKKRDYFFSHKNSMIRLHRIRMIRVLVQHFLRLSYLRLAVLATTDERQGPATRESRRSGQSWRGYLTILRGKSSQKATSWGCWRRRPRRRVVYVWILHSSICGESTVVLYSRPEHRDGYTPYRSPTVL